MKMNIQIDCEPAEARAFLGLPDVTPLNEQLVSEMQKRMGANLSAMQPDELMRSWSSFGVAAQEQFRKMMESAVGGAR